MRKIIHYLFYLHTAFLVISSSSVFCQATDNSQTEPLDSDSINILLTRVNDYVQSGRPEGAIEYLNILSLHDPSNVDYLFAEASIYDQI